ncbi:hypothetical protein [Streptomyces sparsus]
MRRSTCDPATEACRPTPDIVLTASALGPAFTSAGTLLGVAPLRFPGQPVEVDLTAAPPD